MDGAHFYFPETLGAPRCSVRTPYFSVPYFFLLSRFDVAGDVRGTTSISDEFKETATTTGKKREASFDAGRAKGEEHRWLDLFSKDSAHRSPCRVLPRWVDSCMNLKTAL